MPTPMLEKVESVRSTSREASVCLIPLPTAPSTRSFAGENIFEKNLARGRSHAAQLFHGLAGGEAFHAAFKQERRAAFKAFAARRAGDDDEKIRNGRVGDEGLLAVPIRIRRTSVPSGW